MKSNTNDDRKADFLLEEYKQVYEQFRHCDSIAQSKEAIFAVAAFGILALVFNKNLSVCPIIGAAVVSTSLFLFHVIACKRMHFFTIAARERLIEIEEEINSNMNSDNIRFQKKIKEYEQKAKEKNYKKWLSIECMRSILAGILVILWIIIVTCKICDTNCFNLKSWRHYKQTSHHRY